jgi:ComF family protein
MPNKKIAFVKSILRRCSRNAAGFFFPSLCISCGNSCSSQNPWLCTACLSRLRSNHVERAACPRCGQDRRFTTCACEYAWDFPFEKIYSIFSFDDIVKKVAHAFKYDGLKRLAFFCGKEFGTLVPCDFWDNMDLIVPVPLHLFRTLGRGYNQAGYFAAGIRASKNPSVELCVHALRRKRHTPTQTALSRTQRQHNLSNAFCVPRPELVRGKNIVLVDDIVTTGATTGQCSRALIEAGASAVRVLSLARD